MFKAVVIGAWAGSPDVAVLAVLSVAAWLPRRLIGTTINFLFIALFVNQLCE